MKRLLTCIFTVLCFISGSIGRKGFGPGEQEWGYAEVRPDAYMFWWLYYTTANVRSYYDRPLIIWLQGGPGVSSTAYGNFEELGPLDTDLNPRNYTWVKNYNVLFIDSPVGTGFSYVKNTADLATTDNQTFIDLLQCIDIFFRNCPKFKPVPTYIVSESYSGKIAAGLALYWNEIQSKIATSNLKGIALGNPWISPIDSIMTWGKFLRETDAIDTAHFDDINDLAEIILEYIDALQWSDATYYWVAIQNYIYNIVHNIDFDNILTKADYSFSHSLSSKATMKETVYPHFIRRETQSLENLMNGPVKKALGLNVNHGSQSSNVFYNLWNDFLKPATASVERLLNNTNLQVLIYNGQWDLSTTAIGTLRWVEKINWNYAASWDDSNRIPLVSNNIIKGYYKTYHNFRMYWVNRAGRMVPKDNPAAMEVILRDLISNANN